MPSDVNEPWRYYSPPLDDEYSHDHLRAVIEAGLWLVKAEQADDPTVALMKAQQALLRAISAKGRADALDEARRRGGKVYNDKLYYKIFCIADGLECVGVPPRNICRRVSDELSKLGIEKTSSQIRRILKKIHK